MPEGIPYGPQFTASTGLTLNVVGSHCYAYSGSISVNNNETTLLEFETGNYYVVATVSFGGDTPGSPDYLDSIYLNDEKVLMHISDDRPGRSQPIVPVMVPPFTTVKITSDNVEDSNANDRVSAFVGRIYK